MLNFKEITKEGGGVTKNVGNPRANFKLANHWRKYPIIDNIFLSYNLVEHYVSPILQRKVIEIVAKGLIMLKIHNFKNLPKKLPTFMQKIHKLLFLLLKWIWGKIYIYLAPKCQTLKGITLSKTIYMYNIGLILFLIIIQRFVTMRKPRCIDPHCNYLKL